MSNNKFPRIKSYYTIVAHSPNYVELRMGVWNPVSHYINDETESGNLYKLMVSFDGQSSPSEIAKKNDVSRSDVESLIDHLNSIGAIEFGPSQVFDCYIDHVSPSLRRSYMNNEAFKPKYPLTLLGDGIITSRLEALLNSSFGSDKLEIIKQQDFDWKTSLLDSDEWLRDPLLLERKLEEFKPWQGQFLVLAMRHIDPNLSSRLNKIAFELNIPWLHVAIDGPFLFVGPLFPGKQAPCYDCFEKRINMNLRDSKAYLDYKAALLQNNVHYTGREGYENIIANLVASYAAMEIMNYNLTDCSFIKNKVFSVYLPSMEISYNEVLRLSNCVTCGTVIKRENHQLYFDYESALEKVAS